MDHVIGHILSKVCGCYRGTPQYYGWDSYSCYWLSATVPSLGHLHHLWNICLQCQVTLRVSVRVSLQSILCCAWYVPFGVICTNWQPSNPQTNYLFDLEVRHMGLPCLGSGWPSGGGGGGGGGVHSALIETYQCLLLLTSYIHNYGSLNSP